MKEDDQQPQHQQQQNASHNLKKKRVGKACDSCRIKKTKCDGKKPCNKCVLDNKICVFTEKRKLKEKNHPNGYVELLETRLDILTRSFEKLIELSQPHLPFIDEIIQQSSNKYESSSPSSSDHEQSAQQQHSEDNHTVPINKIVAYLIEQQGLLKNLPMEWEQGAFIAANYDYKSNHDSSVQLFAQHKFDLVPPNIKQELNSPILSPQIKPTKSKSKKIKLEQDLSPSISHNSMDNQFSLDNTHNIDSNSSDMDSDSPIDKLSSPSLDYIHKRAGSLLNQDTLHQDLQPLSKINSVSSLTQRYDDHSLSSPPTTTTTSTTTASIFSHMPAINSRRSSSSTLNNKIQKPQHHSHHRSSSMQLETKKKLENNNHNMMFDQPVRFFNHQDDPYDEFTTKAFNVGDIPFFQSQPLDIPYHQNFLVNEPSLDHFVSSNNPFMGNV